MMRRSILGLYRLAIRLYPSEFRRRYGPELMDEAEAMLGETHGAAGMGWIAAAWRLALDTGVSLGREWRRRGRCGATRRWRLTGGWRTDLHFALRSYRRSPLFAATAIFTLALGIGSTAALFGVVDATLLRPLPYVQPDRLVALWPDQRFSRALLDLTRAETQALEAVTGYDGALVTLTGAGEPVELFATGVPQRHFDILGIHPIVGRPFTDHDHRPGTEPVVILSHALWQERFGGEPTIIGKSIDLSGEGALTRTVVGILPVDFTPLLRDTDVWIPIVFDGASNAYASSFGITAVGRLRPEVTVAAARADLEAVIGQARERWPGYFSETAAARATVVPLQHALAGDLRPQLLALFGAVGLVLLVACLNVANLILARNGTRTREIAIRAALGAGRGRVLRQLLVESAVLAFVAGGLGLLATVLWHDRVLDLLPGSPAADSLRIDARLLVFAMAVAAGTALLAGCVPGWMASGANPAASLRGGRDRVSGSASQGRFQQLLLGLEIATATTLVFTAALLLRSAAHLASRPMGFDPAGVLTFRLTVPARSDDDAETLRFFEAVRTELETIPGVLHAGIVSRLPMGGGISRTTIVPEGLERAEGEPAPTATHRLISPGYLDAMGIPIVAGRDLEDTDTRTGTLYGLVNQTLAERFWPGQSAIGRRFMGPGGRVWFEVVGVVGDVREDGPGEAIRPAVYIPHRDWARPTMYVAVRAAGPPTALIARIRQAAWTVDPGVPVTRIRPMIEVVERAQSGQRRTAAVATLFAVIAVSLGAVGVASVASHTVTARRRELGIRAAFGARQPALLRLELARTTRPLGIGLLIGAAGALSAGRLVQSLIVGVDPGDPKLLLQVVGALIAVGIAAAAVPAWHGTAIDPARTLRL